MSEFWNQIVNTAILGTDKKSLNASELPESIGRWTEQFQTETNKETAFLKTTALAFNFRQCGTITADKSDVQLAACEDETLPYCSAHMIQLIGRILDEDHLPLLQLWLEECHKDKQLVKPQQLPILLQKAKQHASIQSLVMQCGGKRAEWLSTLNPEWTFEADSENLEETWLNGKLDNRKKALAEIRKTDANKGLQWLQSVWAEENANTKASLLKVLEESVSETDLVWLESLLAEKAQKVKDETVNLLKRIPGSSVMQLFISEAQKLIYVKEEKTLGIVSKQVLKIEKEVDINELLFKYNIDKLSSEKNRTDTEWIAFQLLSAIPPSVWETHLNLSPDQIIEQFNKRYSTFLDALSDAALLHKDTRWARFLLDHASSVFIELIGLLPLADREKYAILYVDKYPLAIVKFLQEANYEWSLNFTRKLLAHTSKEIYSFNKAFYRNHVLHIPLAIVSELESFGPTEEYYKSYWQTNREELAKLLEIKQLIIN